MPKKSTKKAAKQPLKRDAGLLPHPAHRAVSRHRSQSNRERLFSDISWIADHEQAANANWHGDILGAIYNNRRAVSKSTLAQGFVNAGRFNAVGNHCPIPTLSNVKNAKDRPKIEELWHQFALDPTTRGKQDLVSCLRALVASMLVDGRVFVLVRRNPDFPVAGTGILLLERDWLADQDGTGTLVKYGDGLVGQQGIIRRPSGRISHYAFLGKDISEQSIIKEQSINRNLLRYGTSSGYEKSIVPANQVLDLYDPRNAGDYSAQTSWLRPAMNKLYEIARLDAALVAAMENASQKYGFIKPDKDAPSLAQEMEQQGEDYVPNPTEFVEGTIEYLNRGDEFQEAKFNAPNGNISLARKEIIQNIAAALGGDYATIAGDTTGTNYSALRHASITARENYKTIQSVLESKCLRPLFKELLDMAQLRGEISISAESYKYAQMTEWRQKAFSWVDPVADVMAAKESIKMGIDSPQRIAKSQGRDWREIMTELAECKAECDKIGIPFPPDQPSQPAGAQEEGGGTGSEKSTPKGRDE